MSSVFALEDELARSIATALRPQLLKGSAGNAPLVQQPTSPLPPSPGREANRQTSRTPAHRDLVAFVAKGLPGPEGS